MLNIPFAPGVGYDRFIPKSSKNVDGRPVLPDGSGFENPDDDDSLSVFSFGAASLTLFLEFFKRRSMAAMESSSLDPPSSSPDAALMRIPVRVALFLPADEDEEKAEETRLCASRDREDRANMSSITSSSHACVL